MSALSPSPPAGGQLRTEQPHSASNEHMSGSVSESVGSSNSSSSTHHAASSSSASPPAAAPPDDTQPPPGPRSNDEAYIPPLGQANWTNPYRNIPKRQIPTQTGGYGMPVYERMQTQPIPVDVQLKQEYLHRRIDAVQQSGWCMLWSPYASIAGLFLGSAAMGYVEKRYVGLKRWQAWMPVAALYSLGAYADFQRCYDRVWAELESQPSSRARLRMETKQAVDDLEANVAKAAAEKMPAPMLSQQQASNSTSEKPG